MAQGLSTPDPSLSPTRLSIRRGRATTTHYTHHQVSLMVSRNTTLVPSLGLRLRIGPACEAGLSAGMRRERVSPQIRKKERKKRHLFFRMKWKWAEILCDNYERGKVRISRITMFQYFKLMKFKIKFYILSETFN